ncbi:MAG TPA: C45 family autoproteolytic acyltransferase/hydrolase [Tepidisphaeraceae bacterium]|nr:C45 family autoproteolytic acyltransferase/hydrolase [Tepidisphaeraceae bacterium]
MRRCAVACVLFISTFLTSIVFASEFIPDPATVQREGPAYRYPQAGWIVLHVEGKPYERGRQQGKLMWREIQNYIKCFAAQQSNKSPADGWALTRTMTDALFVRRFDPELLEEMKGIADGAAAAGAKFDGRSIDLTDIVAINVWPELLTLDDALHALPTGLEGKDFGKQASNLKVAPTTARCSAFAATGAATSDGKAIIGHTTMFDLYPCDFFNVWIDVKPAKGHRLVFQGAPGSVQSGMDWYINDAGIVLTETTIGQTRFDPNGLSIGSRSRHAMQYGDSIDSVVKLLGDGGNGLYTNEWLLADMKSNEIALFELGTKTRRLMRSSKNEWFGGTTGFYWGDNNTKDLAVRMETIAATNDRPADMVFHPEIRDMAWIRLYEQNKGKIDANFGKVALSQPPLASRGSCDAKYTTADMALHLQSFAHWGDPYDQLWEPSPAEHEKFPDATPIVPNDWTVLTTAAPASANGEPATVAVDLKSKASDNDEDASDDASGDENESQPEPAWHGTILPAGDGDIWLASAFARFDDYVASENELIKNHENDKDSQKDKPTDKDSDGGLTQDERDKLAIDLFQFRAAALSNGMGKRSVALREIKSDPSDNAWFFSASGRGGMLLSELRRRVGPDKFDTAMDAFGRAHAGQPVDSQAFVTAMSAVGGASLGDFFAKWLDGADALPTLELSAVSSEQKDSNYIVSGHILSHGGCTPMSIDVTVESENDETTSAFPFVSGVAEFHVTSDKKPTRVVVNKYGQTPCANGWNWTGSAYKLDLAHTLIIYGTRVEAVANRIAAEKLQQAIIDQGEHAVVPIKPDTDVSDDDLRGHHLLLIGRPQCSELIERLAHSLPVTFGPCSFIARGQLYAHAESAVIAAGTNPQDPHYCIVCVAGLSPGATLRAAKALPEGAPAPVKVMAANQKPKDIVPPTSELVHDFK